MYRTRAWFTHVRKRFPQYVSLASVTSEKNFCPFIKSSLSWEFPGDLVVRIPGFHCHDPGSIPGWGTEILQAVRCSQKKKKVVCHMILTYVEITKLKKAKQHLSKKFTIILPSGFCINEKNDHFVPLFTSLLFFP